MKIDKVGKITINKIVDLMKKGEVFIFPTDTVYGLIADATNKKAVGKIFKIKKREKGKSLPIFVKSIEDARKIAKIDKYQEKLLKKFWPGKITTVLFRKKTKVKLYGVDKKTIALRIPKYKLINDLQNKIDFPLTGTSANISGKPASIKIDEVIQQFKSQKTKPDFIINAGNLKPSKSSRVFDLTGKKLKILR
ncbi:MAG: L-threonylcarbamoyladenylate synthase [Candidatus Pacebacteria bacterium]|nr:L-threonylcarbamoyladenylate synthase [Candidatus Paceibacterota bacterium]